MKAIEAQAVKEDGVMLQMVKPKNRHHGSRPTLTLAILPNHTLRACSNGTPLAYEVQCRTSTSVDSKPGGLKRVELHKWQKKRQFEKRPAL